MAENFILSKDRLANTLLRVSDATVAFAGQGSVTMQRGQSVWSDAVGLGFVHDPADSSMADDSVFRAVIQGISSPGDLRTAGYVGLRTLLYFEVKATLATILSRDVDARFSRMLTFRAPEAHLAKIKMPFRGKNAEQRSK